MSQQISDLVINLDVDTAMFKEQMARIRGQLSGMGKDADGSSDRMRKLVESQTNAIKGMGDTNARVMSEVKSQQSSTADTLKKDWEKASKAVDETHRRVAELNRKLQESQSQSAALGRDQDALTASFFRQIDGTKQLSNGMQSLGRIQEQIRAARKNGNITQQDYLTLLSHSSARIKETALAEAEAGKQKARFLQQLKSQVVAQKLSGTELLRFKAAQVGAGDAAELYIRKLETAKTATRNLGIQSAAARRELGVLVGELARGNFGALRGSGITLANRAGWIEQLMSLRGLGLAAVVGGIATAVYVLGKAWYQGSEEAVAFNRQLILTGNYASKTSAELQSMAKSLSGGGITQGAMSSALASVVGSGSFSGNAVTMIADTAAKMQASVGQSVDETIRQFKRLQDDPVQSVLELDKTLHFLTATQLEQITTLAEQGRTTDAARIAMDTYANAMRARSADIKNNLGDLESAWKWLGNAASGAWDQMLNVGRESTLKDKVESTRQQLERAQKDLDSLQRGGAADSTGYGYGRKNDSLISQQETQRVSSQKALVTRLQKELGELSEKSYQDSVTAARAAAEQKEQERQKRQFQSDQDLKRQYETSEEKHQREILRIKNSYASQSAKDEAVKRENARFAKEQASKVRKGPQYKAPVGDKAEESSQADLQALQAQLVVLQQHKAVTDVISQQRKDLWKSQAQFAVLEAAATKRQLTTQEQSLLASKSSVLAYKARVAAVGDEVVLQERLNRLNDQADKYLLQQQTKRDALLASQTKSSREVQRGLERSQLLSGQKDNPRLNEMLDAQRKTWEQEDQLRSNWQAGGQKAWADYADAATDAYSVMKDAGGQALTGLSSQLTTFLTTGKADFKSFTSSILSMLTEILVKMALVNGVKSLAGAMGWGGIEANAKGGVYSSASLSAYSGSVVDKPTFFAFAKGGGVMGEAGPEAILPLRRGANGKLGVVAGSGGGGSPVFHNTVILQNDGSATSKSSGGNEAVSKTMMKMLDQFCQDNISKSLRPGGQLFNAMKGR